MNKSKKTRGTPSVGASTPAYAPASGPDVMDPGVIDNEASPAGGAVEPDAAVIAEEDGLQQIHYEIRHDLQKRIDLYLRDRLPGYSRAMLQKLIKAGNVIINARPAKSSTVLRSGDVLDITLPHAPPDEAQPENIPLEIIYEDDDLIAINKQSKLLVHPARGHWTGTLINALLYHAQQTRGTLSTGSDPWRPGIIHRLDRDTTGLIVVAKRDEAHWRIAGQFERRTVKKTYLAIVHGSPGLDNDLIDAPLGVHPKFRERYAVREDGRPAQTIYSVKERFSNFSILELYPKTGRTHQLRVHLAHIGHPIVGDTTYGGQPISLHDLTNKKNDSTEPLIDRQALHAYRLQFVHPTKFNRVILEARPPGDMIRIAELLRKHRAKPGI